MNPDPNPPNHDLDTDVKPRTSNLEPDDSLNYETQQSGHDLLDYLLIIAKNKKMIFCTTFIAAVIAVLYSLSLSNIYTAKTMILPGDEDKGIMGAMMAQLGGVAGLAGDALGGKTKADLYATMLKSETIKDKIIDRFKLMEVYEAEYRVSAYKALDGNTKITIGKKDGVITIAVDDKDPKRAANMANAYVVELGKFATGLNMAGAGENRAFLEKRIAETRADLAKAEDALKAFQSKNKAISITDQAKATIEGVGQLRAQLAIQEVQLATIQRQFTDSSQEVKSAKTAIANLRAQIAGLEGKGGGSSSIPNVGSVPALGQEFMRLMREFKIQEAVLEMLVKQYEMASLSEAKDVSILQIIQVAKVPERKSKPSRSKIVLGVAFATGFLMVVVAFLIELSKQLTPEDQKKWKQIRNQMKL
jgi:uncharacterized protein involved in exopolysaccharide biosynthesis